MSCPEGSQLGEHKHEIAFFYMPQIDFDWDRSLILIRDRVYDSETHGVSEVGTVIDFETSSLDRHIVAGLASLCAFGVINGPDLEIIMQECDSICGDSIEQIPGAVSEVLNSTLELQNSDGTREEPFLKLNSLINQGTVTSTVLKILESALEEFSYGGMIDIIDGSIELSKSKGLLPPDSWASLSSVAELLDYSRMLILAHAESIGRKQDGITTGEVVKIVNKLVQSLNSCLESTSCLYRRSDFVIDSASLGRLVKSELNAGRKLAYENGTYKVAKADRLIRNSPRNFFYNANTRSIYSLKNGKRFYESKTQGIGPFACYTKESRKRIVFKSNSTCPAFTYGFHGFGRNG